MTTRFLGFRLAGPLASWGDVTVGDLRTSWPAPSASALMGLLAAAHGIRREDEKGQQELAAFRFAVRLDSPGVSERDYHTVQSSKAEARGKAFCTRKDELSRGKVGTKLTERSYYTGQVTTVLAWGGDLERAAEALWRPEFFLCLGRRACPPSRPLGPAIVEAATILAGFFAYDAAGPGPYGPRQAPHAELLWDARPGSPVSGLGTALEAQRRDLPVTRGPDWAFAPRRVASARWPTSSAGEGSP